MTTTFTGSDDVATATEAEHVSQEVARIAKDHVQKDPENMGGDRSIEVSWMSTRPHGSIGCVRLDQALKFY
ncbi:MAG TPA: hypothetical protein VFR82_03310 [Nitrospira sp.]|nr:hypothetical protein [Nitrospira sp.]